MSFKMSLWRCSVTQQWGFVVHLCRSLFGSTNDLGDFQPCACISLRAEERESFVHLPVKSNIWMNKSILILFLSSFCFWHNWEPERNGYYFPSCFILVLSLLLCITFFLSSLFDFFSGKGQKRKRHINRMNHQHCNGLNNRKITFISKNVSKTNLKH